MHESTDRITKSTINIIFGFTLQIVAIICGFLTRKIFLNTLGIDLQGIHATLTSIITMLSLGDLGLSFAIYAALYKPIAQSDHGQIIAITNLCARLYRIVAGAIFAIGLLLLPFLHLFFNEADLNIIDISYIRWVFVLFLADCSVSYLFSYRWVLFNADQNMYIISRTNTVYTILMSAIQVVVVSISHSYVLFVLSKIVCVLVKNLYLTHVAGKKYDYLRWREKHVLNPDVKKSIYENTKALALHRFGNYAITGTDTLIISKLVNISTAGIYSNYYMIITAVTQVATEFTNGVSASLGNIFVTESTDRTYAVFKNINFTNFMFYNFAAASILTLVKPFISLWLGADYLLPFDTVIFLTLNFFNMGVAAPLGTIRANAGLFKPDRYLHILYALLNLVISILLVRPLGISGVFIGTLASYIAKEVITLPVIVYRDIFALPVRRYYAMYFSYIATGALSAVSTYLASLLLESLLSPLSLLVTIVMRAILCIVIPNAIAIILFWKTPELKNLITVISSLCKKIFAKFSG